MTLEDNLVGRVKALYDAIARFDAAAARHLGVHPTDLRCLNLMEHGPISPGEIGTRLGLTSGSVTALISRLDRAGLVQRRASATDRRRREVGLRPRAWERVSEVYSRLGRSLEGSMQAHTPEERAVATRVLGSLTEGWDEATLSM